MDAINVGPFGYRSVKAGLGFRVYSLATSAEHTDSIPVDCVNVHEAKGDVFPQGDPWKGFRV